MKVPFRRFFNSTILILCLFVVTIHHTTLSFRSTPTATKIIMLKTCLSFSVQTITKRLPGQQVFHQEFPFRTLLNAKSPSTRRRTYSRNRNYTTKSQRIPILSDHHSSSSSSSSSSSYTIGTTTTTMPKRKKNKFYAVAVGRTTGIYSTWDECQSQVKGYSNARFKSFSTVEEAQSFLAASAPQTTAAAHEMEPFARMAASVQTKRPRVMASNTVVEESALTSTVGSAINPIQIEVPSAMAATAAAERPKRGKSGAARGAAPKTAAGRSNDSTPTNQNGNGSGDDGTHGRGPALGGPRHPHKLWFHVMFDGGSRGNPHGHAGSGTYVLTRKFYVEAPTRTKSKTQTQVTRTTTHIRTYLGSGVLTNNQAEYTGLVTGLKSVVAALEDATPTSKAPALQNVVILVQGDSDLIVKQMNGVYACKSPKLKEYYRQAKDLAVKIRRLSQRLGATCELVFEHVYREDNTIADGLANQAMDAQRSWTTSKGGDHGDDDDDGAIEV